MLNYVWISLVIVGILVAAGNDLNDELRNTYRNGVPIEAVLEVRTSPTMNAPWHAEMVMTADEFNALYGVGREQGEIRQPVTITTASTGESSLLLPVGTSTPAVWKEMGKSALNKDRLSGKVTSIRFTDGATKARITFVLEPIRFVKIKAVTQAALEYAATAVNIALGLIGIMALWLGVMKVAEEAGLIRALTKVLIPITKRLFPDVPSDHPAIGAMIMNISANMLGLSNAATPFGLKAMEELNKLNPTLGTATNAMCTFLVINTSGLVLIPATAIAVRAAAGSANPGIIIGTSIFGAGCATVAGLLAVKILEKLPHYRKQLLPESGGEEVRHG